MAVYEVTVQTNITVDWKYIMYSSDFFVLELSLIKFTFNCNTNIKYYLFLSALFEEIKLSS